ncbi:hypothetical protein M409DRAFT_50025 [Zasmidium cellare ATCC 36951]|uniref:Uncharacterized protein n=1 Tax=Zasmidium cellare ATCC 36951 TaxID=1080233 RepID=A0A6A6D3S2_ZASCE|nr:uncharacterized protein M409DRAFT_50025 [Zasmidium cellare ATCC 36951]KAF2172306.1 hypothetical protein M409DRAFT_50025 [Zasmidium cellare ATCC 36951]
MAIDMITSEQTTIPTPKRAVKKFTRSLAMIRKPKTNFFSLPGELRNKIYRYSMPSGKGISLDGHRFGQLLLHKPVIIFAEARLFQEAGSIYFLDNTFWFEQDTLNVTGVSLFEDILASHAPRLKKIGIRRHYTIGDMKPIVISFIVEIIKGRITIVRPSNEEIPFPGCPGYAKFRSPYAEPCRCEVRAIATRLAPRPNHRVNGYGLLHFLKSTRTGKSYFSFLFCGFRDVTTACGMPAATSNEHRASISSNHDRAPSTEQSSSSSSIEQSRFQEINTDIPVASPRTARKSTNILTHPLHSHEETSTQ